MLRVYRNFKLVALIFLAMSVLLTEALNASLLIRQPSLELLLNKGEHLNAGIVLENLSNQPLTVKAGFADILDKQGNPNKRTCSKWIKLSEENFVIPPNSIKDLRLDISVPNNADGGYWTGLVFSYSNGQFKGPEDMTFNVMMHIEMPVSILIADTIKNNIEISSLDSKYDSTKKILNIHYIAKNTGNSFYELKPNYILLNQSSQISGVYSGQKFKIYPDEEKEISFQAETGKLTKGTYLIAVYDIGSGNPKVLRKKIL